LNKKLLLPVVACALALALGISGSSYLDCYGRTFIGLPETVPLDSYSLSVMSCGHNKPTVIIEPGLNVHKESYYGLLRRIFPYARIMTYDHAGIGESTLSDNPRTLPFYVEELRALLAYKKMQPPYILVGHSLGGHIVRYYTDLYPDEVAGLVFLDHPHEDWFRYIRANWSVEEQREYFNWWNPELTNSDQVKLAERLAYDENNDLIRGKEIPASIPVLMFTGDNFKHFREDPAGKSQDMIAWAEMQHSLIDKVESAKQIVDWETGHWPHRDKPDEVAREIREFIDEVKLTR